MTSVDLPRSGCTGLDGQPLALQLRISRRFVREPGLGPTRPSYEAVNAPCSAGSRSMARSARRETMLSNRPAVVLCS